MKIVAISDVHLDHVSSGVHRFEEAARAVDMSVECAIERKVDVWAFLGDAMNPDSGSCVFKCLDVLVRAVVRTHAAGIIPVLIAGNHCICETGDGSTVLTPLRSLPGIRLFELPGSLLIKSGGRIVQILALPFTATSRSYDPAAVVAEQLETHPGDHDVVVLSHLNVRGVVPGSESLDMPRGRDVWLPDEELAAVARWRRLFVLQGHYHRGQEHVTPSGLPVRIIGSPLVLTHGEEGNHPSFLVVDL